MFWHEVFQVSLTPSCIQDVDIFFQFGVSKERLNFGAGVTVRRYMSEPANHRAYLFNLGNLCVYLYQGSSRVL